MLFLPRHGPPLDQVGGTLGRQGPERGGPGPPGSVQVVPDQRPAFEYRFLPNLRYENKITRRDVSTIKHINHSSAYLY